MCESAGESTGSRKGLQGVTRDCQQQRCGFCYFACCGFNQPVEIDLSHRDIV